VNYFIFQIDQNHSSNKLQEWLYDSTASYIDQSYRYGVVKAFGLNQDYKTLSTSLKNRLVFQVLDMQYQKIFFFFNDVKDCNYADLNFVRKVLTSLDCSIYFSGQTIIQAG
jgi:hypothetical protein